MIERNLLDVKRQMNFERKLPKDDREIYNCLKPFARFFSPQQFDNLFEGIVLEKNLRLRLNQLKMYRKLGCNTYEDIERYLEMDFKKSKDKNLSLESSGIGPKINKLLKTGYEELTEKEKEKEFLRKSGIDRETYQEIKARITKDLKDPKTVIKSCQNRYNLNQEQIQGCIDFLVN